MKYKNRVAKLARRQKDFDAMKGDTKGYRRPGSTRK